jgi:hypothetical protein
MVICNTQKEYTQYIEETLKRLESISAKTSGTYNNTRTMYRPKPKRKRKKISNQIEMSF